jgi:ABC-2 type transport system ATP-binding protein
MIEVTKLTKTFPVRVPSKGALGRARGWFAPKTRESTAVDAVSFKIERGESVAFIGPNGAGKSTTIKMLTGILHPTSGECRVAGLVPWSDRKRLAFKIGAVFGQRSQLWYQLPARDSLELLGLVYEVPRARFRARLELLVKRFELAPFLDRPVRKLSLGERMRCEVAASLLHEPEIVFLDEPTIGLDVIAKREVRELIRQANRDEGVTVFLTSHDAGDVEQVCKRVMVVDRGNVVVDTTTGRLKRDYLKTRVVDLVAERPMAEVPPELGAGMKILKASGLKYKIWVDTEKLPIDRALDFVIHSGGVADIVVSSPPMEEIIAAIYSGTGAMPLAIPAPGAGAPATPPGAPAAPMSGPA